MGNQPKQSAADESGNKNNKSPEDEIVTIIREYFDDKTGYDRVDKLSQAYLYMNFTEEDVKQIKEKLPHADDSQNITLEQLRYLFKAYCESPEFIPDINFPKLWGKDADTEKLEKICLWWDKKPDGLFRKKIWEFGKAGTIFATVFSLLQYCGEVPKRQQQNYFQAWQLINTASTQPGQGGRVQALEYINKDKPWWIVPPFLKFVPKCKKEKENECLVGVKIEKANLNGVDLEGANLTSSEFGGTSFRDANLKGVIFKDAEFAFIDKDDNNKKKFANFKGANLENADLSNADDFDPSGAILCNTTMPDKTKQNRDCKAK
jgi:hypothetical protein